MLIEEDNTDICFKICLSISKLCR